MGHSIQHSVLPSHRSRYMYLEYGAPPTVLRKLFETLQVFTCRSCSEDVHTAKTAVLVLMSVSLGKK